MRILAFHGFWKKSEVWDEFRRHFNDCAFFAPNINWEKEKSADFLDSLAREKKPDVIIGYSYGGYAVQQLFELEIFAPPDLLC